MVGGEGQLTPSAVCRRAVSLSATYLVLTPLSLVSRVLRVLVTFPALDVRGRHRLVCDVLTSAPQRGRVAKMFSFPHLPLPAVYLGVYLVCICSEARYMCIFVYLMPLFAYFREISCVHVFPT